jgi:AmmeMemoRadiSam system protein A
MEPSVSTAPPEPLAPPREVLLPGLARGAIAERLGLPSTPLEPPAWLATVGACFVTLHAGGELRGCIGSLLPHRSLLDDVRGNARAAAFGDPRFPPVALAEYAALAVEVSVLSPLAPFAIADESEAISGLRPHVDGVVLEWRSHRGTFLPQVWAQLPAPAEFLAALKRKAGLARDFWAPDVRLFRYTVEELPESPARPAFAPARAADTSFY